MRGGQGGWVHGSETERVCVCCRLLLMTPSSTMGVCRQGIRVFMPAVLPHLPSPSQPFALALCFP